MWKAFIVTAVIAAACAAIGIAQETHTLTTPQTATTTTYTLQYVGIDVANLRIVADLTSNTGVRVSKVYDSTTTPTGATLLHNLNTGNFSVNSLIRQVYQRLATDGVIPAGSISGTAQH